MKLLTLLTGVSLLLPTVTPTLQVLHHPDAGALLLTLPSLNAAPPHHHPDLLLAGLGGDTALAAPVTGSATLEHLHMGRGHLEYYIVVEIQTRRETLSHIVI